MKPHLVYCMVIQVLTMPFISRAADIPVVDKIRIMQETERQQDELRSLQKREDSLRQAKAKGLYNELKIEKEADACVVFRMDNFHCQLDVQTFNSMVDGYIQATGLSEADSVSAEKKYSRRLAIVEPLVEEAYLGYLGETSADRRKVVSDARKQVERVFLKSGETLSDSLLRSIYQAHARRFQGGTRLHIDILASTDSSYIDSVQSALSVKSDSLGIDPRKGFGRNRPYSTILVQEGGKPLEPAGSEDLFALAKDAPLKRWIRPPPRKFGHLLFLVRAKDSIPPVQFHEAKPLLTYLAQIPVSTASEQPAIDPGLKAYYDANRAYFRNPDTLFFRIWLWPFQGQPAGPGHVPANRAIDTGSIAPLLLTQFDLPAPLQTWVYENLRCCVGNRWSPSGLPYGKWTFRLQRIAKGRGFKPFASVRDSLSRHHRIRRDPYLQVENTLHTKTRAREQSFWREKVLSDLRSRSEESTTTRDSSSSHRDGKSTGSQMAEAEAGRPDPEKGVFDQYQLGIRKWASEYLDLSALEEGI